jgi:UDP-2,4-diacetamido-2,4,6-trideoxy-beta-L-altropyranose hydrolase
MKVAIRADAFAEMGTGHVMRCIALGQGVMMRGGEVVFLTYCSSEGLVSRLRSEGFKLHLLNEPGSLSDSLGLLEKERPDWIVLDGYHFDTGYQQVVKDAGYRLLVIDDYVRLDYYHADIILNQNYGAENFRYNTREGSKLLLGTKYVMLRKEFLKYWSFERSNPEVAEKLLITMGGADPDNNTLTILKAVNLIEKPLNAKVVVGAANPHYEALAKEVEGSTHSVEILRGVEDMAPLMAWADAAVSAGGSTVWELAFMGLPAILSVIADNQEYSVNCLVRDDVFMSLGRASETSVEEIAAAMQKLLYDATKRTAMLDNWRKIVDGKGVDRIIDVLMHWPLKILFLGGMLSKDLSSWLEARGEKVFYTEERVDALYVADLKPDMIISYNYRYMLGKDILCIPQKGAINLHISYLPWNRGAHPNVWSFIEGSPKGVTIHYIDDGIDTGDILVQEEVIFDDDRDTLMSSYVKLHKTIQDLFKRNWAHIRAGSMEAKPQPAGGTMHFRKDSSKFEALISEKTWNTPVKEITQKIQKCSHIFK